MVSHKIIIRFFIVTLLSFLMITTSSFGLYQDKLQQVNGRQEPIPHVEGVKGDNSWYISDVVVSFSYDPKLVSEIQYFLDGDWHIYVEPFTVSKEGVYLISWIWFDDLGAANDGQPFGFKIDKTPPTIELTRKSSGKNKVIFTATVTDEVSLVKLVEFYLDDVLQQNDTEAPYQYTWTGEEKQTVYAIGYDYAGLFEKSNNLSTIPKTHFRNHNFMNIFIMLLQKIFIRF